MPRINIKTNQNIMKTKLLIPLIAGLGLLCACKGRTKSENADSTNQLSKFKKSREVKTDSAAVSPKLVKTADMRFKVKNVQQTSDNITTLAKKFNGTIVHHMISSAPGNSIDIRKSNDSITRITVLNTTAEMTVKVPPINMENFMSEVSHLGLVNHSKMDITDKSLEYLATRMKLKNQDELIAGEKKNDTGAKDPNNLLSFKNNMVDQKIQNHRIDDSVKSSTITLSFYESNVVSRETIANDNLSAYNPSFLKRLSISIENGWSVFEDIFIAIANFWILIPIAAGIWLVVKFNRQRMVVKS
ncbi:MAG: DUF4349 domain-containing protein [Mucilaginibacter sp.]